MKVLYCPCVTLDENEKIEYHFDGEMITVKWGEYEDIFDFTNCPDGMVEKVDTTLPENPILEARREDGVLYVKLLKFISPNAPDSEKFPDWVEVGD